MIITKSKRVKKAYNVDNDERYEVLKEFQSMCISHLSSTQSFLSGYKLSYDQDDIEGLLDDVLEVMTSIDFEEY
ncbi:hypothetical protein [Clostridium sp.]|uniref:hypothetical protein n=1 Tax=Clostridium sp. TaxID=1506 RepID=UPI001A4C1F61|nr:hypothetical protein [Clostridium sp.]MBK5242432.1 hypothetical protein [Clostridium sp.]